MPLNDIAANLGSVARTESIGHAKATSGCRNVINIVSGYLKTVLAHMFDPIAAATAVKALEYLDRSRGLRQSGRGTQHGYEQKRVKAKFHGEVPWLGGWT